MKKSQVRMYPYVTRIYTYVTRMLLVCTRMYPCGVLVKVIQIIYIQTAHCMQDITLNNLL